MRVDEVHLMDLFNAYEKFRKLRKLPANGNAARQFYKFLGIGEPKSLPEAFEHLTREERAVERIEWLNGPNAEVLYRIWKAQNE